MGSNEETDWIDDYGPYWQPVYNIIKKITGLTVPFLDFLSPTFLLFPLVPFSHRESKELDETTCDMCGDFTTAYVCVSLDTELEQLDDDDLERKIMEIEDKLKKISMELIVSINHRENLSLKIDHLHDQLMSINSSPIALKSIAKNAVESLNLSTDSPMDTSQKVEQEKIQDEQNLDFESEVENTEQFEIIEKEELLDQQNIEGTEDGNKGNPTEESEYFPEENTESSESEKT